MENPEYKEIEVSQEVKKELREITDRMYELCKENNIPFVLAFINEKKDVGNGIAINTCVSRYLDYDSGAWSSSLFAASCIIRLSEIPFPILDMLADLEEAEENSTGNNIIH